MSTRSGIGVECEDGSVVGVYCHFDGYPEGVGRMLADHYADRSKALELVGLGSISSLGSEIGEKHPFDDRREDWTRFYGRDRGEKNVEPRTYPNRSEFQAMLRSSGVEFFYVLGTSGDWSVSRPAGPWKSLKAVLAGGLPVLDERDPDRGADILIERECPLASVVLLRGVTGPGRDWLDEHVDEDAPVFGGRIAAETRYAVAIVEGARRDGLVVEEDV